MKPTAFSFLFLITLGLAGLGLGCAKSSTPRSQQTTWVEHGDPLLLLRGVSGQSEVTIEDLQAVEGWWLSRTKVILARTAKKNLLEGQNVGHNRIWQKGTQEYYALKFRLSPDGRQAELFEKNGLNLRFVRDKKGIFRLTHINGVNAVLVHFSRHTERQLASLLLRTENSRDLKVMYISSEQERGDDQQFAAYSPKSPHYFLQPNRGRWRQAVLHLDLCGFPDQDNINLAMHSIHEWQKALAGYLEIKTQVQQSGYRPFSDLNQHCVYWDDGYQPNPTSKDLSLGAAHILDSNGRQTIVDGDAYIYAAELNKQNTGHPEFDQKEKIKHLRFTFLHELGHILGLAHQPQHVKSVMAYQKQQELQPIDIEAIRSLYAPN